MPNTAGIFHLLWASASAQASESDSLLSTGFVAALAAGFLSGRVN